MRELRLFDSMFKGESASAGGWCKAAPKKLKWLRDGPFTNPTVYTDSDIFTAMSHPDDVRKVLWLLEPEPLHPENYQNAIKNEGVFDKIITHNKEYAELPKWEYSPYGGSWVDESDWKLWPKTADVSIIASEKDTMPGHKLRHAIIDRYGYIIDGVYGQPRVPKIIGTKDYRFSIVVESAQIPGYFTEKIVDAFLLGAIPIYWGDPTIGETFVSSGILRFKNLEGLQQMDGAQWKEMYVRRMGARNRNFEIAKKYVCAEDWLEL